MKQTKPYQNLRVDRNSIINLEKGKIPPQAIDLEEVVLGAMMIDKKGVDEVIDILNSEAFIKKVINIYLKLFFLCLKIVNLLIFLLYLLN